MKKLGFREAQIRAMREAQFEERQRQARKPAAVSRPETQRSETAQPITNSVTNAVTNYPSIAALNDKARVARWRAKNPDRYRTYMRNLMRKIRAERRKAAA